MDTNGHESGMMVIGRVEAGLRLTPAAMRNLVNWRMAHDRELTAEEIQDAVAGKPPIVMAKEFSITVGDAVHCDHEAGSDWITVKFKKGMNHR
jgi:hypothetical protein